MTALSQYFAKISIAFFTVIVIATIGFILAGQTFMHSAGAGEANLAALAEDPPIDRPVSVLLGTVPDPASESASSKHWVEVVEDVNMRSGPSTADRIVKVQHEGARLKVSDRDGNWVQVIEPGSGTAGWIYERYVKGTAPSFRSAGSEVAHIR